MTEGMTPAPFSTTPEAVADAVVTGLAKGREVIWAPPVLRSSSPCWPACPAPLAQGERPLR